MFKKYKSEKKCDVSETTLRQNTPKHYKRARKETDLCEYCETEQPLQKQLKKAQDTKSQLIQDNQPTETIDSIINQYQESLDFISHHKIQQQKQREIFKSQISQLNSQDTCVVAFDFKENIRVGCGPREIGRDFYDKSQRSVFGMVVYYVCDDGSVKHRFVHVVSEVLSHDGLFVRQCLTKLLSLEWMTKYKSVSFWSDCGPHFRNYEVLNHVLFELPKYYSVATTYNFWGEKHGKNPCDSDFSVLSQWLNEITANTSVNTTLELLSEFNKKSNENTSTGGLVRDFLLYERNDRPTFYTRSVFKSIKMYHSFTAVGKKVHARVLTTDQPVVLSVRVQKARDLRKDKYAPMVERSLVSYLPGPNVISQYKRVLSMGHN